METIIFRNFFAQLNDTEIDFVIFQLNKNKVFEHQVVRSNVGDIDATFIKFFVRNIEVGFLGSILVDSISSKIQPLNS
jgi:hypothetical protein